MAVPAFLPKSPRTYLVLAPIFIGMLLTMWFLGISMGTAAYEDATIQSVHDDITALEEAKLTYDDLSAEYDEQENRTVSFDRSPFVPDGIDYLLAASVYAPFKWFLDLFVDAAIEGYWTGLTNPWLAPYAEIGAQWTMPTIVVGYLYVIYRGLKRTVT